MAILSTRKNPKKRFFFCLLSVLITFSMITSGILILTPEGKSNTGGPDTYGYRWIDSKGTNNITYNWTDGVTGGTNLMLSNQDNSGPISLGFRFPFYSRSYSTIRICDNGWASFTHSSTTTSDTIPSQFSPNTVIAPFWTDLDPAMYTSSGNVYYKRMNTSTPKHFIITWESLPIFILSSSYDYNNTVQAIIYENGSVLFQYKAINITQSNIPIVGIENEYGNIGLQYSPTLTNKTAVMFYYNYPEHELIVKDLIIPDYGQVNEDIQLGAAVKNWGLNDETNINVTLKINSVVVNWTLLDLEYFTDKIILFTWRPSASANYSVEVAAKPVPSETNINNNKINRNLDVRKWRLIMLDRSQGEWMDWGYFSEWFTELFKYNFYVEEHHSGTITSDLLNRYEAVIFPTPTFTFTSQELTDIHNYVTTGHGMLVFGYYDYYTNIYDDLTQPYEITWENYDWGGGTTSKLLAHEITYNISSIYINTARNELKVTGGAKGLVWDTSVTPNGIILAISNESTPGRVAAYVDPYGFVDWSINMANNKDLAVQIMEWVVGDTKPPARPRGFKVSNGKVGNQLNLSWKANTEKDLHGYNIYRRTDSGTYNGTPVAVIPSGTNTYDDKNLQDHTKYFYQIAAIDEVPNISPMSIELSGTPTDIIAPESPMNFTAKDVGTGYALNLSWNKNPEPDVVAYNIYKSSSVDGPFTEPTYVLSPDTTFYQDTEVVEGENNYYILSAVDEVPNESELTYMISATPFDRQAPSQPSNFNVSDPGIGNTLSLTWSPNPEDDLVDYLIERKDSQGTIKRYKVNAQQTYFNDTNLVDGKTYHYRLYARDNTKLQTPNKSPPTPWVWNVPTDITPPEIPQNFSIIDGSYSTEFEQVQCLNLTWNVGNDSDLRGYRIYRFNVSSYRPTEEQLLVELGLVDHYLDYDVSEGIKFYYKITAFDEVPNESPPGITLKGEPKDVTPPSIPKGFKALPEPEGNTVSLTWELQNELEQENGGYRLYFSSNQTGEYELIGEFSYNINDYEHTNLIDDQIYYYKLQAFDEMPNYSPFTPIISVIPSDIMPPSPPKGLRIVVVDSGSTLQLSWRANDEEDLNGYRVYRRTGDMPYTMVMAVDKNTTSAIDEYLIDDKAYKYYITAMDEVPNESEGSVEKEAVPKDGVAPEPVPAVLVELTGDKKSILLSWTQSNSSDAETYRIFRSTDGKNFKKLIDVPFTDKSYIDDEVENNKKYYYQISALDEVPNISPRSDTVSIKVPTKETSMDTNLLFYSLLGVVILIILFIIIAFLIRKGRKKDEPEPGARKEPKPAQAGPGLESLPMAIPGGTFSTPASMPGYEIGPQPEEPKVIKTEPIKTISPGLPLEPSEETPSLPSLKSLGEIREERKIEEEESRRLMDVEGVGVKDETTGAGERQEQVEITEEPSPSITEPRVTPVRPQHPVSPPTPTGAPIRPVMTVTPPAKKLPTILIPLDHYGNELIPVSKKQGEGKQESITFPNPEIYNVPRRKLTQPPVGKVVKRKSEDQAETKKEKKQKDQPKDELKEQKEKKGQTKQKEKKTSEDDIKKLLEQYMT